MATKPLQKRFWEKVNKTHDCWLWTAYILPNGYPRFSYNLKPVYAHHLAWSWINGEIPEGHYLLRTCKHKECVRPDHMELKKKHEPK